MDTQRLEGIDGGNPPGRAVRLAPWLIVGAWLAGTVFAFRLFELQMPKAFWCGG